MTELPEIVPGIVYLVGAGPGDPGLLTRAGAEALSRADVVVYDRLADDALLSLAPATAELVYVGKQAAMHSLPQPRINELLVEHAVQGRLVVRLKGGDPFVFGRGGEEASYLQEHGLPFVVVPGVSSAVAVPAYAGIPVTDRRLASSFAVITGHEDPTKPESRIDWSGVAAGADTLVFLMGMTNLATIAARLVAEGRSADTPAAVIERGATPGQRVVTGTLADIAARVRRAGLHPPALVVVGEVVQLRERLAWYESEPLAGRRVLVPRVRPRPSETVRLLKAAGAETTEAPPLRREVLPPHPELLERLAAAGWVVFTSSHSVEALLEQLSALGADVRALGRARLVAIGAAAHACLCQRALKADVVVATPAELRAEDFAPEPGGILVFVEEGGDSHVRHAVEGSDGEHLEVPVLRFAVDERMSLPTLLEFDAIALASSGTVRRLMEVYPEGPAPDQLVVSIGPATTATARSLGVHIDVEAGEASPAGLVQTLIEHLGDTGA